MTDKTLQTQIEELISELKQVKERLDKCEQGQAEILDLINNSETGLAKQIYKATHWNQGE